MTKKQHYLPQFYLKNFASDNGKIWTYDRYKGKIYACSPRDIACEKYLYETRWEDANPKLGEFVLPNQFENKFAEREGEYSKLLQKIIGLCSNEANKGALICNKDEKETLASFVSNMYLRNPWSMAQANLDCVTDGIMDVEEIKVIDNLLQLMEFGGTESLVKFASKRVWLDEDFDGSMQQESTKDLRGLKCCFIKTETKQFVTSSFPVLHGIDETTAEEEKIIYFPLHPHIALLYGNTLPHKVWNRIGVLPENDIDFWNKQYYKLEIDQVRFIYAKEKSVLEKLVK